MAEYTVELRKIIESGINIFDFPYNFYDESKRKEFEQKFIRHFYFREIGCETVERFKWYLQDKMNLVFPYYNELFKSATIEYDVLDNYKLIETYTRNIESNGKTSGIASSVGTDFSNSESESAQERSLLNTSTTESESTSTETANASSESTKAGTKDNTTVGTNDTDTTNTDKETSNKTNTSDSSTTTINTNRFLDTPQGLTDLTNSNYLTELRQDNGSNKVVGENTETGSVNKNFTGKVENDTTSTSEDVYNETNESSSTSSNNTTNENEVVVSVNEKVNDNTTNNMLSESKSTSDSNTRTYTTNNQTESYTINKRGNIGVDTDSDAIEKHNRLQKTLRNIEQMFFDECEDLFMLVY